MKYLIFTLSLAFTLNLLAATESNSVDNKEIINGVKLLSGKIESNRFYQGTIEDEFITSAATAVNIITDFEQRCNNEFSDEKKLLKTKGKCKYFNTNLIESKVHPDIKINLSKKDGEIRRFLVSRRIYNRSYFSHTDLIRVFKKTTNGKSIYTISQTMLTDGEVKKYMKPLVKQDSVFLKADAVYTLTELSNHKTKIKFEYSSKTDHWLLNKSISVGKVFSSMSKNLNNLFSSLKKGINVSMKPNSRTLR